MLALSSVLSTAFVLHGVAPPRGPTMAVRMMAKPTSAYDFSARDLATGDVVELSEYAGSVSLFVNVASQ